MSRLRAFFASTLLFGLLLGSGSPTTQAASAPPILEPIYSASAWVEAGHIRVRLTTRLTDGERVYRPEELPDLRFRLSDHALRGHTVLVALPAQARAEIADIQTQGEMALPRPDPVALDAVAAAHPAFFEGDPFWFRQQWAVRLRLTPVRVAPDGRRLLLAPVLMVTLSADRPLTAAPPPPDPLWEPLYRALLVNYADARGWRGLPAETPLALAGPAPTGSWRARLGVAQPGLHEIGYEDLKQAGIDPTGSDPRTWQVYRQQQPLPCLILGEEDGRFDPGDVLLFYAPPWEPQHSPQAVYWLVAGASPGLRVAQRPADHGPAPVLLTVQETIHLEKQLLYRSDFAAPGAQGRPDHWFWTALRPQRNGPNRQTLAFELPPLAEGPVTARLRLRLFGQEEGTVQVSLWLRDYPLGRFRLSGRTAFTYETEFPHALLQTGENRLLIEVAAVGGTANTILLDWLAITCVRRLAAVDGRLHFQPNWPGTWQIWLEGMDATTQVWEVSDPQRPVALVGLRLDPEAGRVGFVGGAPPASAEVAYRPRYEAATRTGRRHPTVTWAPPLDELGSPTNRADYLILTPEVLLGPAQRLAAHRARQGLAAKVVTLEAIYDEFNAGQPDPEAIRAFLATALSRWRPPVPAYVVLFGDGHHDPLNYLGTGAPLFPVVLRDLDPWLGEVADENRFAAVLGADSVPDLMVGRLPVGDVVEAERLVDKLIAYDSLPTGQPWQNRLVLVADNADGAGDFAVLAEHIASLAVALWPIERLYYGVNYASATALRERLLAAWNEGALIVNYSGHGQVAEWGAEQFLAQRDLPALQNTGRPAVVLVMASLSGIFYRPGIRSLQEALLLLPDGRGAIGYLASTGYGIGVGNGLVNEGFIAAFRQGRPLTLGEAALSGRMHLFAQGYAYSAFLVDLFALFGDPATRFPTAAWGHRFYLPLVGGWTMDDGR
ncbi:MAG: C25 family cysteine peptidase [Caldilineales bacterium]|nr:C25 family cysteine peptidase [Caldilineales bacterium]